MKKCRSGRVKTGKGGKFEKTGFRKSVGKIMEFLEFGRGFSEKTKTRNAINKKTGGSVKNPRYDSKFSV